MTQKAVRSFTLSDEVVEQIDAIPNRERSRVVDQILRRMLPQVKQELPVSRVEVELIVRQVLAEVIGREA